MIDTIVLTIQPNYFQILSHDKFSPSTKGLFEPPFYRLGKRANFKCVQNPAQDELKKGIYKPRLTAIKRPQAGRLVTVLRIEFSIPKLIFNNNFDEVEDSSFEEIIKRLKARLDEMDVLVFPEALRSAPISAVHYSKNIVLTDYSTPSMILDKLKKVDLNQRLDLNQTDFRNEGHSLKFRANTYEISLYDKKKDLQKAKISEKRAIERDNAIQLELFDQWKPKNKVPFEVLRLEIRLNKRSKIIQIFNKLKIVSDLTFSSVFKKQFSQKVLLHYFNEIKNNYSLLAYRPKSTKDFIADFRINNPKIKIRKMLQMLALKKAIEEMGIREFREVTKPYGKHNWDRLKSDLSTLKLPTGDYSIFKPIEKVLRDYRSIRLPEFEQKTVDLSGDVQ